MPRKHQPTFKTTPSNYVHPSLASGSASSSSSSPRANATVSVNERLNRLRREDAARTSSPEQAKEITALVSQRTVPPSLRQVLNLPETAPPPPPPVGSRRVPVRGRRGPPGPAPPKSWLEHSRHAPPEARGRAAAAAGEQWWRPDEFGSLAGLEDAPYPLPERHSLMCLVLKTLATEWEQLVEYEQHYLATIPVPLKGLLLSFLSVYGPDSGVWISHLKLLFLGDQEITDGTGADQLTQLDLSGLFNEHLTMAHLAKYFTMRRPKSLKGAMEGLSLSSSSSGDLRGPMDVAESWEEEVDNEPAAAIPVAPTVSRFPNLTRLSLSHPGPFASWPKLLEMSAQFNTLTHLSLAYWPTPTTTPNATTTSMVGSGSTPAVSLGGRHFYSVMDNDWHEAANILRRLSKNTYCLRWLDLEGCDWVAALTWGASPFTDAALRWSAAAAAAERDHPAVWGEEEDGTTDPPPGPDWNGAWRQIEHLRLAQGWVPTDSNLITRRPAGVIAVELLHYLRHRRAAEIARDRERAGDRTETGNPAVDEANLRAWMVREKDGRDAARVIRELRQKAAGRFCQVDFGWSAGPVRGRGKKKEGGGTGGNGAGAGAGET